MISCKLAASVPVLVLLPSVDELMMELIDGPTVAHTHVLTSVRKNVPTGNSL